MEEDALPVQPFALVLSSLRPRAHELTVSHDAGAVDGEARSTAPDVQDGDDPRPQQEWPRHVCVVRSTGSYRMDLLDSFPVRVGQVWEDGPAYAAGIRAGDRIIQVLGQNVVHELHSHVIAMFADSPEERISVYVLAPSPRWSFPSKSPCHQRLDLDGFGFVCATSHAVGSDKVRPMCSVPPEWSAQFAKWNHLIGSDLFGDTASPCHNTAHFEEAMGFSIPMNQMFQTLCYRGVPHRQRPLVWWYVSQALKLKSMCGLRYDEIAACSITFTTRTDALRQIRKDLLRTFPENELFCRNESEGVARLQRMLLAISWFLPDTGYCQGIGMLAATLLLVYEEEQAFWMMVAIIQTVLPPHYYNDQLTGATTDQLVLKWLLDRHLPELAKHLDAFRLEPALVTLNWFITLYANVFPMDVTLRLWDVLLTRGSVAMFEFALAILKVRSEAICSIEDVGAVLTEFSDAPTAVDPEELFREAMSIDLHEEVQELRTKARAVIDEQAAEMSLRRAELKSRSDATDKVSLSRSWWGMFGGGRKRSSDSDSSDTAEVVSQAELSDLMDNLATAVQAIIVHVYGGPDHSVGDDPVLQSLITDRLCPPLHRLLCIDCTRDSQGLVWDFLMAVRADLNDRASMDEPDDGLSSSEDFKHHRNAMASALHGIEATCAEDKETKFTALVCHALNVNALHTWVEIICRFPPKSASGQHVLSDLCRQDIKNQIFPLSKISFCLQPVQLLEDQPTSMELQ